MKGNLLFFVLIASSYQAQVLISDLDYDTSNRCQCANLPFSDNAIINFFDTDTNGNYGHNQNEIITFCPDVNGNKMRFASANISPYLWDIDASDSLYVFDGISTNSPLLYVGNSSSHPLGVAALGAITASWNNFSGCLTFQFISDSASSAEGWAANISCVRRQQPFFPHMIAQIGQGEANGAGDIGNDMHTYIDTGYVDICLGDSILYIATTDFPNEPEASPWPQRVWGYNQSGVGKHISEWRFSDGTYKVGDSVWFTPTQREGYFVTLRVTDSLLQYHEITSKIRVSTRPNFSDVIALDQDICLGETARIIGGSEVGNIIGAQGNSSAFHISGYFDTLSILEDGSGQNYSTSINISDFPSGATLQNAGELERICISMEHSNLNDLEIMLTCPNGQNVIIVNAYDTAASVTAPGLFSGGFSGGGAFVGGADQDSTILGTCEKYCFSDNSGALPSWANGFSTIPASGPSLGNMVAPDTYRPEEAFLSQLSGCPLNGDWTLTVRDNVSPNNGWICDWNIDFSASTIPNNEIYTNTLLDEQWQSNSTILSGLDDTMIIVRPAVSGNNIYSFEVEDNFGCTHSTDVTVSVIRLSGAISHADTCDGIFQYWGTYAPDGGNWWYTGPGILSFFPSDSAINPEISTSTNGLYTLYFNGNQCNDTLTSELLFLDDAFAQISGKASICEGDMAELFTEPVSRTSYTWINENDEFIASGSQIEVSGGIYTLIASNICHTDSAVHPVLTEECFVPNVITPNSDGKNDYFYTNYAKNYDDVTLAIYNRWGKLQYETSDYQNDWQGVNKRGKKVPDGVYFYILTYDNGLRNEKGTISVFGN